MVGLVNADPGDTSNSTMIWERFLMLQFTGLNKKSQLEKKISFAKEPKRFLWHYETWLTEFNLETSLSCWQMCKVREGVGKRYDVPASGRVRDGVTGVFVFSKDISIKVRETAR